MKETIWSIDIEVLADGQVNLEQDSGGETQNVFLHPTHVRFLFEHSGYLKPVMNDELAGRLAKHLVAIRSQLRGDEHGSSVQAVLAKLDVIVDDLLVSAGMLDEPALPISEIQASAELHGNA